MSVKPLTRFASGSFLEVAALSLPLMMSALSVELMLGINRVIMARHCLDDFNAAASVDLFCFTFQFALVGITTIAEVFAGQYLGARDNKKVPIAVWQMIWLALMSVVVLVPLAFTMGPALIPKPLMAKGIPYFQIFLSASFVMPLVTAISSFFVVQGKTRLIFSAAASASLFNFVIAYALIPGVPGWIEPWGATGAAVAITVAQSYQFIFLLLAFLSPKNRQQYHTHKATFDWEHMKGCLKIGAPNAANYTIEMGGWTILVFVLAQKGTDYLTVRGWITLLFVFFGFFTHGIERAVIGLASNLLGAKEPVESFNKMLRSACLFVLVAGGAMAIGLCVFAGDLAPLFLGSAMPIEILPHIISATYGMSVFFIFDSIVWVLMGILTSGGDTRFTMLMNVSASWLCVVIPGMIWLMYFVSTPASVWTYLSPLYAIVNASGMLLRYYSYAWRHKIV